MVTLYDAIKIIQNRVFVFFSKKEQKPVSLKKRIWKTKKTCGLFFFKPRFFQRWPSCFVIFFDRTIWNKSRHYQFD